MTPLTPHEREQLVKDGLIKLAGKVVKKRPAHAATVYNRPASMAEVLKMIEAEIQALIDLVRQCDDWKISDGCRSVIHAYRVAIKIIRDHHVICGDGKPMRGLR